MMSEILSALLLVGCAAGPKHKGAAEVSPLDNAPGDVQHSNPRELSERKGDSDTSDIPVGGHIRYSFAEYILSGAVADSIAVNAAVFVGEAGLQRTELDCDILDPVGGVPVRRDVGKFRKEVPDQDEREAGWSGMKADLAMNRRMAGWKRQSRENGCSSRSMSWVPRWTSASSPGRTNPS